MVKNNDIEDNWEPASLASSAYSKSSSYHQHSPTSFDSPEKKVAISALHHDIKSTPENWTTIQNSDVKNGTKKLFELSEIYSTMKINDTPEYQNTSQPGQDFPGYLSACFKEQQETMIEHSVQEMEPVVAQNQQNSIDTLQTYKIHHSNKKPSSSPDSRTNLSPDESPKDYEFIICRQNKIISQLTQELTEVKLKLKNEQRDKFKLAIQLEQVKRRTHMADKEIMTTGNYSDQVCVFTYV